ncbi:MAG: GNAT family N-acetyltransferase [Promethearchaeota archaeon]
MTNQLNLEIIEGYRKDLAAPMAAMFNAWDELWPGSFTQGVPYTPERVNRDFGSQRVIAHLIAWDKTTKETVGYCSLLQHWRDSEAAYIGLLGVSKRVLGKKVGKRLLLRGLAIATQKGFHRVDLYTWAGNLRAVPLYKKMGLMWDPEGEGVLMRGFIPAILQHPLCAPFFLVHDDPLGWYTFQQRELTQAPDDMQQDGMKVYTYSFQAGSDKLQVIVDRYANAISGVDYTVEGRRLQVNARVKDHVVFCGIPSEYILEVKNESNEACSFSVELKGFAGLHFDGNTNHSLTLPPHGGTSIRIPFSLDSTAPLFRKDFKSPMITANLHINGKQAQLYTGMKIQPVAEIQMQFGHCRLVPRGKITLPVTIRNNTSLPFEGIIRFHLPEVPLTIDSPEMNLKMKSKGFTGATIEIAADKNLPPGTYDIWASLQLNTTKGNEISVTTRRFRIPIFNITDGYVAIGEDDRRRRILAITKDYTVHLAREGGTVTFSYPFAIGSSLFLRREIGPPFGLSPFRYAEQEVQIEHTESSTVVSLSAQHFERPLLVETRVIFDHHSPVVQQEIWVTNIGSENHTFQLRLDGPGGISLEGGKVIIPLQSGILEDRLSSLLSTYPAIPGDPKNFRETWVAAELPSLTRGQVWNPQNVEEIQIALGRITRLSYCSITLAPQEKQCLSQVWQITKAASREAIRRTWQEKVLHQILSEREEHLLLPTTPIMKIAPPPLIIPYRSTIHQKYQLQYVAAMPQSGQLTINPPSGWTATICSGKEGKASSSLLLENITKSNNPQLHLTLKPDQTIPNTFAIYKGYVNWKIPIEERQSFPIVQLGSSRKSVKILEEEDQGLLSYQISNGVLQFKVSPQYGGTLYSLRNSFGTELLNSAFPTPTPKIFLQNYFGGWQSFVSTVDEEIFQANTNQEKMRAKSCQVGELWRGVEIQWKGKLQDCCRGVDFRLQYLTAAGSPLILSNWKIRNATKAPLQLMFLQGLDAAFNGDLSNALLQAQWGGTSTTLHGSPIPAAFRPDINLAWLRRNTSETTTSEGIAFLTASTQSNMLIFSTHEVSWFFALNLLYLHPKEEQTIRSALFINPPNQTQLEDLQRLLNNLL